MALKDTVPNKRSQTQKSAHCVNQLHKALRQPNQRMVVEARMVVTSQGTKGKTYKAAIGYAVCTRKCTHMQNSLGHRLPARAYSCM